MIGLCSYVLRFIYRTKFCVVILCTVFKKVLKPKTDIKYKNLEKSWLYTTCLIYVQCKTSFSLSYSANILLSFWSSTSVLELYRKLTHIYLLWYFSSTRAQRESKYLAQPSNCLTFTLCRCFAGIRQMATSTSKYLQIKLTERHKNLYFSLNAHVFY